MRREAAIVILLAYMLVFGAGFYFYVNVTDRAELLFIGWILGIMWSGITFLMARELAGLNRS